MRNSAIATVLALSALVCVSGELKKLQIGVKHRPADCTVKAAPGDKVSVHYEGRLTDGTVFDSSYKRDQPISFPLGAGQVIKGWDQGISGMCVGEKRKLKIPSHLGYGDQGSPPTIPGQVLAVVTSPSKSFVNKASAHVLDQSFSKYP